MRPVLFGLMVLFVSVTLTGCGKKPGRVDAPPESTGAFPRTYPDPSNDS